MVRSVDTEAAFLEAAAANIQYVGEYTWANVGKNTWANTRGQMWANIRGRIYVVADDDRILP